MVVVRLVRSLSGPYKILSGSYGNLEVVLKEVMEVLDGKIPNLPTSSVNSNIRQNMFPLLVKFLPHHHHLPRVPSYIAWSELTGRRTLCSSPQSTHCNTRNTGDTPNFRVSYILEGTFNSLYIVRRYRVHRVNLTSQGVLQIN